jgi:tetratricopeptide (TPR) repeat protein
MLVATFRTEEAPAVEHLRRGLARLGLLEELRLSGLGLADIKQLLRPLEEMLPVDEALVQRLHEVTGGNPFFLLEMLRSMVENGCRPEDLADPAELCLPDTVREAIAARVDRLSATGRQVLEAASVLGRSFSFELVRKASGRGEPETLNALDELVQRLFLEEGTTGFWFRHEITQSAVYHLLSRQRRTVLHRRAAATLERLDPSDAAALARHFELGGQPGHAARFAMQAGRAAKEVFAHDEARAQFEKALELLVWEAVDLQDDKALAANRRLRLEALHERGWALRLVGEMEAYAEDLQDVGRLASALGDARSLAHLQWREAYAHRWFCRYAQALASAKEGVALSRQASNPLLEAMCQREIGMASRALGDYAVARKALEQALALFVELGETVYEIHTLGNLATLSWYEGKPEQALDLSGRALQRCDEACLPLQRRLSLGDMGAAAVAMGALDLARQSLEESLSIARQTADRTQEILCLIHLGWLAVRLRRGDEALQHFNAGLKLAERIRSCNEQSWLQAGLAEAHRLSGERQQALTHARQAQELAQASGAAYDRKLAHWVLSRLE